MGATHGLAFFSPAMLGLINVNEDRCSHAIFLHSFEIACARFFILSICPRAINRHHAHVVSVFSTLAELHARQSRSIPAPDPSHVRRRACSILQKPWQCSERSQSHNIRRWSRWMVSTKFILLHTCPSRRFHKRRTSRPHAVYPYDAVPGPTA